GPADLAVEIVSPDSPRRDRVDKFAEYQKGGVREYWIIDPLRKTADFFRLSSQGVFESMPVRNGIMLSRVLPGLWLEVEWLWQEPLPRFMEVLRHWGLV
ncbi:MAG: Uma2 family endonuclease, partial [Acidobacteriota bacterium]